MVNNRNRTGAPAFAIPWNRHVHRIPEWIHSFQILEKSATQAQPAISVSIKLLEIIGNVS
jgi:hypothetical protein